MTISPHVKVTFKRLGCHKAGNVPSCVNSSRTRPQDTFMQCLLLFEQMPASPLITSSLPRYTLHNHSPSNLQINMSDCLMFLTPNTPFFPLISSLYGFWNSAGWGEVCDHAEQIEVEEETQLKTHHSLSVSNGD